MALCSTGNGRQYACRVNAVGVRSGWRQRRTCTMSLSVLNSSLVPPVPPASRYPALWYLVDTRMHAHVASTLHHSEPLARSFAPASLAKGSTHLRIFFQSDPSRMDGSTALSVSSTTSGSPPVRSASAKCGKPPSMAMYEPKNLASGREARGHAYEQPRQCITAAIGRACSQAFSSSIIHSSSLLRFDTHAGTYDLRAPGVRSP